MDSDDMSLHILGSADMSFIERELFLDGYDLKRLFNSGMLCYVCDVS